MATYTAILAGGDWNTNATWGGTGHPVAGDTANITGIMLAPVTLGGACACEVLNMTGASGTALAFGNQTLTLGASNTGSIKLAGTITAGTGGLIINGTSTLTSNSVTFAPKITFQTGTVTLVGNWTNTALITFSVGNTKLLQTTSEQLIANGGVTFSASSTAGTNVPIVINNTGTLTFGAITWSGPIIFNYAGNVIVSGNSGTLSGLVSFNAATNLIGAGTIISIGAGGLTLNSDTGTSPVTTLKLTNTQTINSNGHTCYNPVNLAVAGTITMVGNWINNGLVTWSAAANVNKTTTETLTANGGISMTASTGTTGTATVIWAGGTWTGFTAAPSYAFYPTLIIQPSVSNCTFTSNTYFIPKTSVTYVHSTYTVVTNGVKLYANTAGLTLATDDGTAHIVWDIIDFASGGTLSSTTNLWCGTLNAYNYSSTAEIISMTAGITLDVSTAMNMSSSNHFSLLYPITLQSATAASVYLNYHGTRANCNVSGMNFTWIDASGSAQAIDNYYGGTLSNTVNIINRTTADYGGSDIFGIV